MAEPQHDIYTVHCFIIEDDLLFPVKIPKNETVGILKEYIKLGLKPDLDGISAPRLKLYHVEIAGDVDLVEKATQRMSEIPPPPLLGRMEELADIFDGTPKKNTVHIIVEIPAAKRKRGSSDAGDQEAKRARLIQDIPSITPSSVKLKDLNLRIGSRVIYNRPKADCTTVPIALINQVFANFLDDCQNREPTKRDNKWLAVLRHDMLKEYPKEEERCSRFRQIFQDHTDISIPDSSIPGTLYRTDGHFVFADRFLLISEGKNDWVGLNADPQLQAFLYYIEAVKKMKAFKGSPLPCLIIYYVGSLIGFAGAVTVDEKPYFEVLTPIFDLATNQHDALALKPVARALSAVRAALNSLQEYYAEMKAMQPSRPLVKLGFPSRNYYTNDNDARVYFDYEERLNENKLLFRILTREGEQKLILKFTQKYSKEVHTYCASYGIAPALFAVEKLGGGWMMVVMEDLDDVTYSLLLHPDATQHAMVKDAVSILHRGKFVHGDIRDVNVMVRKNWDPTIGLSNIKLLDFDWAGPEGTIRYPMNVNHEGISRPQDATDGELIMKEHDNMMVDFLL